MGSKCCEYCHQTFGHSYGCPFYAPSGAKCYCDICEEGIYDGEEYVESYGKVAHLDCLTGLYYSKLLKWLDVDIQTM